VVHGIRQFPKALKYTYLLQREKMAHNFKINIQRSIDNLYIHLMGDFDGSSACELFNALKENLNSAKVILIDTHKLKDVYPFGREVFYCNFLKIRNQQIPIQFVGPNALQIAPPGTN
jgi:hypothetical protein